MILNDQQLKASITNLHDLNTAIGELEEEENISSDRFRNLELRALKGFSADIQTDIKEYEKLRGGHFKFPNLTNLADLPKFLIRTRIARGWSQEKLAQLTKTAKTNIQRYEENNYLCASLSKILQVADVLELRVSDILQSLTDNNVGSYGGTRFRGLGDTDWEEFPVDEAFNRGWIEEQNGNNKMVTTKW